MKLASDDLTRRRQRFLLINHKRGRGIDRWKCVVSTVYDTRCSLSPAGPAPRCRMRTRTSSGTHGATQGLGVMTAALSGSGGPSAAAPARRFESSATRVLGSRTAVGVAREREDLRGAGSPPAPSAASAILAWFSAKCTPFDVWATPRQRAAQDESNAPRGGGERGRARRPFSPPAPSARRSLAVSPPHSSTGC